MRPDRRGHDGRDRTPAVADPAVRERGVVTRWAWERGGWTDVTWEVPSESHPGWTVAVCTHRRPELVARFLTSLMGQGPRPKQLVVVDASPDQMTARVVREHAATGRVAARVDYVQVRGELRGLTRQRNAALRLARGELVAFFDDDVVLLPGCLGELARVYRARPEVVGVAATIRNERGRPRALWRVRRWLGIVPTLRPGTYTRSGMSIPWGFAGSAEECLEGDWLPGCAATWRTADARAVGYLERFPGYASGEDVEFSLRMRTRGTLLTAVGAEVLHLQVAGGRPDPFQMGYFAARNLHFIHRTCLPNRTWRDAAYFAYAFGVDTLVRLAALVRPGEVGARARFVLGRLRFLAELLRPGT